jgi:endonuclease/exonuclease/phosphatase family metal-dependent hydrolase
MNQRNRRDQGARRRPVRFATFNVLHGRPLPNGTHFSPAPNPAGDPLARAVQSLGADVLALQELDRLQERSGGAVLDAPRKARAAPSPRGWRDLARVPTYPAHRPVVRFDHVLATGVGVSAASGARTPATGISDHRPLVLELSL